MERSTEIITNDPTMIGAVFENGRAKATTFDWKRFKEIVPVKKVEEKKDREIWSLENMRVFNDGTLASPHLHWKALIDNHLAEFRVASRNSNLSIKEIRDTEKDIKAMMAISASARCMEASSGSTADYASYLTQADKPNLDKQDEWAEFIIHGDEEKKHQALRNPMIRYFYNKIIGESGIKVKFGKDKDANGNEIGEEKEQDRNWWRNFKQEDKEKAIESKLFSYLDKDEGKVSLNRYIEDILIGEMSSQDEEFWNNEGYDSSSMWSASRIALDVFLIDKFTRWSYLLGRKEDQNGFLTTKPDENFKKQLKPSPGWGGDPLTGILDPSFLPRVVKNVYTESDEGKSILYRVDNAFCPRDLSPRIEEEIEKKLPCSMKVSLKNLARYSDALFTFLGSSRANGISRWDKDMLGNLPTIIELLDQVYGGIEIQKGDNAGKHLMGLITARIFECKAYATTYESASSNFSDKMAIIFGDLKTRPFYQVEQFLWGEKTDFRSGFLYSLIGPRTRIVFKNNKYGAENYLEKTWQYLYTNDHNPAGRQALLALNKVGIFWDILTSFGASQKKK